ncbi:MAG: hypothetical protein HRF43_12510 [Phycisphaerae bacterium]
MRMTAVWGMLLTGVVESAAAQSGAALPAKADLAPRFTELGLTPRSQGKRDTCSLFAITSAANFEWAQSRKGDAKPLETEFLVWAAKEACAKSRDQAMFYEALAGLNAFGICEEGLMEYGPTAGGDRKPSPEAVKNAAVLANRWKAHWIRLWDLRKPLSDAQITAIQQAIAEGHPVACGLRWPKSGKNEELINPPAPEDVRDGHSITLVGYRDDPEQPGGGVFRFRNSYGTGWGQDGYGLMSYAYVRRYANDALWLELLPPQGEVPLQRFEAEDLPVTAKEKCEPRPQDTAEWNARLWSGGRHLFCEAQSGGFVEFSFEVGKAGRYRVRLLATAAPDYGKVRVALDGQDAGRSFDLRAGRVCPGGSLELGTRELAAGPHRLRVSAAGASSSWSGWSFGLDALDLLPPS